ncbi:hypothetical protein SEVIR_3G321400v4 [Setaria viridis]|uniref:protein PARALOG OF AIPP2 isoform X3 n=1 Tax=Setaria viridis TaxID=4556 RepID=UPI0014935CE5|nr:uncharacterized protein LOC117849878 isoform X3 [Setaria viridis]
MTSSGDRSPELEEDVNVCDICGDVGVEDKLAICSRCNDGAEHTYCMKVKIEEVPVGEWLCEECQAEVQIEIEKKKLEISQAKAGTISSENDVEAEHVGNKKPNKAFKCNGTSSKSKELDARILETGRATIDNTSTSTSTPKVQDGVSCFGGSEAVNRDKSYRDCEQTSGERSTSFNLRSPDGERHSYEKCNYDVSCNFEVKDTSNVAAMNGQIKIQSEVILCDVCGDVGKKKHLAVCSRCTDGAEHIYCMQVMVKEVPQWWLCETCQSEVQAEKKNNKLENSQVKIDASEGEPIEVKVNKPANGANTQSSSKDEVDAKYVGSGESKRRNHASLVGQNSPEPGGLTIEADSRKRVLLSRGCSFKFGTEKGNHSTSQVPLSLAPNAPKNRSQPHHGFAAGSLSMSVSFNSCKIPKVKQLLSEVPLKPKHSKEPSSSITKQVGPMSTLTTSSSFKRSNFCDIAHKAKTLIKPNSETRVLNPPTRQTMNTNRGTSIGCPSVSASMAALVPSPAESAFQHLTKGNNMVESSYVSIPYGQSSKTLGHKEVKKPLSAKAPGSITLSSETSVGILGSDAVQIPYPSHLDYKLNNPCLGLNAKHYDTVCAIIGRSVDSPTMPSDLANKALTFSSQHFPPGYEQLALTAPELNYIWQGGFELWRTGGSPELCDGFQAHLSCSASPKLLELAKKFPSKIQLEELPRDNVWPLQFQENCPTFDSIGLFFFARDIQSYENHYSKLVENIIKCDLALRGNIDTAELLIFASSTLSKNCQRWNMLIFLWGVLRVGTNNPLSLPLDTTKLSISAHQDKLLGSSDFNGVEVTLDVLATPVHCSDSTIHEEHHMISSTLEQFSRTSNCAHKRNVEMANWDDVTNEVLQRKKTKLDGRTSGKSSIQVK